MLSDFCPSSNSKSVVELKRTLHLTHAHQFRYCDLSPLSPSTAPAMVQVLIITQQNLSEILLMLPASSFFPFQFIPLGSDWTDSRSRYIISYLTSQWCSVDHRIKFMLPQPVLYGPPLSFSCAPLHPISLPSIIHMSNSKTQHPLCENTRCILHSNYFAHLFLCPSSHLPHRKFLFKNQSESQPL